MERTFPSAVFKAIVDERQFQDNKYGPVNGKGGHSLAAWLIIIESELEEAKRAVVHGGHQSMQGRDSVRAELVQIAAVAVAALEQHGIRELPDERGKEGFSRIRNKILSGKIGDDPDAAYSEYAEKARATGADPV